MSKIITPYELDGSGDRFETVAVSGSSGQSAAIATTRIGIVNPLSAASAADIVYVAFGTNPTATTSSFALPTGMSEFNIVSGWKVAVISGGTTSKITIVELV